MAEYIDRDAAISLIKQYGYDAIDGGRYSLDTVDDLVEIANRIEALPTEDVAPVVYGRWQPVRESEMTGWQPELAGYDPIGGYICSSCKEEAVYDCNDNFVLSNRCPNCGAKMDGGDNDAVD